MADETPAQQEPQDAPQQEPAQPTTYVMSEEHALAIAAQQHLAAWLTAEAVRLAHELAYAREAAQHARDGLHAYLARTFGLDAAHEPLNIDLARRIITRPTPPTAQNDAPTTTTAAEE